MFFLFSDRRILFDFEKIGDAPACVDKAGINLDGQEGLTQSVIDSYSETFKLFAQTKHTISGPF